MTDLGQATAKRLLFYVRDSRYFLSHRLELAVRARDDGYAVGVACSLIREDDLKVFRDHKIAFHHVPFITDLLGKGSAPGSLFASYRAKRTFVPTIVHAITIRCILVGSFINLMDRKPFVALFAGLGTLFRTQTNTLGLFFRFFLNISLRFLLSWKRNIIVFMNYEDRDIFCLATSIDLRKTTVIKGSGVDLRRLIYRPYEQNFLQKKVIMASRLLRDKGIKEYFEAALILKRQGANVQFFLAGDIDATNPTSLTKSEVEHHCLEAGVEWLGYQYDVPRLLSSFDIYCLPSYHEGLPLAILEAAAVGLPIVTTNIAGCKAVITNGVDGLLVPPRDSAALATGIKSLLENPARAAEMSAHARKKVESEFTLDRIVGLYLQLYSKIQS